MSTHPSRQLRSIGRNDRLVTVVRIVVSERPRQAKRVWRDPEPAVLNVSTYEPGTVLQPGTVLSWVARDRDMGLDIFEPYHPHHGQDAMRWLVEPVTIPGLPEGPPDPPPPPLLRSVPS